jgi:predicted metal-dependent enzyme (double-stranded beta helix superfamily)
MITRPKSPASAARAEKLAKADRLYQIQLSPEQRAVHDENVARFSAELKARRAEGGSLAHCSCEALPEEVAKQLFEMFQKIGFNPGPYQPKDPKALAGYGKYLLFTDENAGTPFCVQVFGFAPGQKTPIHDHPCECVSLVVEGEIRERAYDTFDGKAVKTGKEDRGAGHQAFLRPGEPNTHSIKNRSDSRAVTAHVYLIDGVGRTAAVKTVFDKATKNASVEL